MYSSLAISATRLARRHALTMCALLLLAAAALTGGLLFPQHASAHASLIGAAPEPDSRLEAGPELIKLTFNERIEAGLGSLELFDSNSRPVTDRKPETSQDGRSLSLTLPKLGEDVYTVAYRVISADGHPVEGSYVFVVGTPPAGRDASSFDPLKELGHAGHHERVSTQLSVKEFINYTVRVLYYAALLLASGYFLWMALRRGRVDSPSAQEWYAKWGLWTTRGLIVAVLLYVFFQSTALMEGQPGSQWAQLFTGTAVGLAWSGALVLSFTGPLVRSAGHLVGVIWAVSLLALESWSGHAAAYDPQWLTITLDFVHLAASAVWAGGLALLLGLWFKDRKEAGRFASIFTGPAWVSMVLLVLTGVAVSLLYLPKLDYLFYTSWGTLLIVKTALVLLVLVTGTLLRWRVRRGELPQALLLKADGVLMTLIIIIVGLFTYISPLPANEPVNHHKMGTDMHYTLRITPNVPGTNTMMVKVWLPEEAGSPKSVVLRLFSEDRQELGPIDVPLEPADEEELTPFEGYEMAAYRAEGPYIPFAGSWRAQIRVMTPDDDELVNEYVFRNY
ncbi:copper resistance CopC/CopD family protein [Paenibacillus tarimensis]|uniref:copper resistance CopC/CopD family protein n=1 Tax=Paenibacillus tarimensis TaxID=416012 RepID=UPI001F2F4576|nr:copper resistance protein CopC [Paenibacillus tarimensis]MCF2942919.1 copper resistance protein CopC/CopD [Paenibacillus tarimensis]